MRRRQARWFLGGAIALLVTNGSAPAAQRLRGTAPLPGDTLVAPAIADQDDPAIVAGAGQYLAVYEDERTSMGRTVGIDPWEVVQTDVYATRIAADGSVIDTVPIVVDSSAYSQENPAAGFNGTGWLVAYESRSVITLGTATSRDLRAVRVSASGEVLDPEPLEIDVTDADAFAPSVASDGVNWIVLWTDTDNLFARIVDPAGNVGPRITLATASFMFDSSIAFTQGRFLVTWETGAVRARLFDASLNPTSPEFVLGNPGADPAVATDGSSFFAAWHIADAYWPEIRGTQVLLDGTVVTPGGVQLDDQSFQAWSGPGLAWNGAHYVAAWLELQYDFQTFSYQDEVVLRRFDAAGIPLDPTTTTVLATTDFSLWRVVLASLGQGSSYLGWMDDRNGTRSTYDGFGTVVDQTGAFGPEAAYTVSPPAQLSPGLAPGPIGPSFAEDVNLAVFVSADALETRVVFQRLDGLGHALDPEPVVLAGGKDTYEDTAVAWNGELWLVVWEERVVGFPNGRILGMRVAPDGTVLDASPFVVLGGNDPDVAAAGGDFLVVATNEPIHEIRVIQGMRVRGSDGALLDATELAIGGNFALAPSVAGFDDRWLVAWHRHATHDSPYRTMRASFVLASGAVQAAFVPTSTTLNENSADLAVVGPVTTLAWSDGQNTRLRQILQDGTLLGPSGGVVVTTGSGETTPTIAWDGLRFVVSSVDFRAQFFLEPRLGDLFGVRVSPDLVPQDPSGFVLAADPKQPEGEAAIRAHDGQSIVLFPAILSDFGNWRVSAGTLGGQPNPKKDRRADGSSMPVVGRTAY